jgi:hypothetical protein
MQGLIDAYQKAKGNRTPEQLQLTFDGMDPVLEDARCKITKEMENWSVAMVKYAADRPELGIFEKLSQKQRLDLLQIMYESPNLNTTGWNVSGTNCFFANFGEEIVVALLKYAPNPDKAAIIGYFNSDKKILPRFYRQIDNKSILPDDHNFDQFIRELIIANAVYLAAKQIKPSPTGWLRVTRHFSAGQQSLYLGSKSDCPSIICVIKGFDSIGISG